MGFLSNTKIKNKIILIILTVGFITSITGSLINYSFQIRQIKDQLVANTILQSKITSQYCGLPLEFDFPDKAKEALEILRSIPAVNDGILFKLDSAVFASYHIEKSDFTKIPFELGKNTYLIQDNYIHVLQPVIYKEKHYGNLYLRAFIDWKPIIANQLLIMIGINLISLLIIFAMSNLLHRFISVPIVMLTNQMNITAKSKNYSIQFKVEGKDELSELYLGFNNLMLELSRKIRLLESLNIINNKLEIQTTLEETLVEICKVLVENVKFNQCWVGWVDEHNDIENPISYHWKENTSSLGVVSQDFLNSIKCISQSIINTKAKILMVDSEGNISEDLNSIYSDLTIKKYVVVPIRINKNVKAVLAAYPNESGLLTNDELVFLESVASNFQKVAERRFVEDDLLKNKEILAINEERLTLALEATSDAIWEWNFTNGLFYCSERYFEMLGYQDREIYIDFEKWKELCHKEDLADVLGVIDSILYFNESKGYTAEYRMLHKNGTWIWILSRGNVVKRDINNRPLLLSGVNSDITERKAAQLAIKESEEKYHSLVEHASDAIFLLNQDTTFSHVNTGLCKLIGYSQEELLQMKLADVYPEHELIKKPLSVEYLEENKKLLIDRRWKRKDGVEIDVEINTKVIEGKGYLNIARDITERKKMENELKNQNEKLDILVRVRTDELASTNEELKASNEELHLQKENLQDAIDKLKDAQEYLIQAEKMASLGVLAAGVAHEINNPLNFIQGSISLIDRYLDENLKEHKTNIQPLIESINTGVKRSVEIVKSLSHYSRSDKLKVVKVDIQLVIDSCLAMLNNEIKYKTKVVKNYTKEEYNLFGHEGKLHQVFLNILSNANQSIVKDGIIKIDTIVSMNFIEIQITDNGVGIPKENLKKIFDPFFTTKETGKGTGLGLSITYKIIQEHNGTIAFDSEYENGTRVKIKLPLMYLES